MGWRTCGAWVVDSQRLLRRSYGVGCATGSAQEATLGEGPRQGPVIPRCRLRRESSGQRCLSGGNSRSGKPLSSFGTFSSERVLKAAASFVSCFCRVALRARSAGAGSRRRCRVEDGEWAGLAPHAQGFLRESSSRRLRFLRVRRFASAPWNEACFRRTTLVPIERCLCRTSGGGTV
jgi:hypothetical protein